MTNRWQNRCLISFNFTNWRQVFVKQLSIFSAASLSLLWKLPSLSTCKSRFSFEVKSSTRGGWVKDFNYFLKQYFCYICLRCLAFYFFIVSFIHWNLCFRSRYFYFFHFVRSLYKKTSAMWIVSYIKVTKRSICIT